MKKKNSPVSTTDFAVGQSTSNDVTIFDKKSVITAPDNTYPTRIKNVDIANLFSKFAAGIIKQEAILTR